MSLDSLTAPTGREPALRSRPRSDGTAERALVLGSTGYIGGRLVPRLLAAGYRVRVLVRGAHRVWSLLRIGVPSVDGCRWGAGMPSAACSAFSMASRTTLAMWSFSMR